MYDAYARRMMACYDMAWHEMTTVAHDDQKVRCAALVGGRLVGRRVNKPISKAPSILVPLFPNPTCDPDMRSPIDPHPSVLTCPR